MWSPSIGNECCPSVRSHHPVGAMGTHPTTSARTHPSYNTDKAYNGRIASHQHQHHSHVGEACRNVWQSVGVTIGSPQAASAGMVGVTDRPSGGYSENIAYRHSLLREMPRRRGIVTTRVHGVGWARNGEGGRVVLEQCVCVAPGGKATTIISKNNASPPQAYRYYSVTLTLLTR